MHTIPTLTLSSLKMFVRNRQSLFFTLFMPTVIMLIFGLIGFDKPQHIDVGVVTSAPTPATQQFVDGLSDVSVFNLHKGALDAEKTQLQKGNRVVVFQIPDTLMPDPAAKQKPQQQTITVYQNVGQAVLASTAIQILGQMLDRTTIAVARAPQLFTLDVQQINAKNVKYIDFLLPGIVAMSIMQMAVFSVAFVFVDYKERGVLKRLLATPMKPIQFVASNVTTRLLVALAQTAILVALGLYLFHAHVIGSYWLVLLISILGGFMFLGLGFTISGLANTVDSVPAIANLIVFPMLFLSGVFFPTTAMPEWLQRFIQYLPLSYFTNAMREVMANGAAISAIAKDLYWMGAWAVVLVILAIVTFRFEERRV